VLPDWGAPEMGHARGHGAPETAHGGARFEGHLVHVVSGGSSRIRDDRVKCLSFFVHTPTLCFRRSKHQVTIWGEGLSNCSTIFLTTQIYDVACIKRQALPLSSLRRAVRRQHAAYQAHLNPKPLPTGNAAAMMIRQCCQGA